MVPDTGWEKAHDESEKRGFVLRLEVCGATLMVYNNYDSYSE